MGQKKICAIVKDNFLYYNRQEELTPDFVVTPHAPISCLTNARGSDICGGTAYMTKLCCPACMAALGSAGVKKIVYKEERQEGDADETYRIANYYEIELVKNEYLGL